MLVTIYGKSDCTYCDAAKEYLDRLGVDWNYYDVGFDKIKKQLESKVKFTTVPQIFLEDKHIGGYKELLGNTEIFNEGFK